MSAECGPLQFRLSTIFVLTLIATVLAAFLSPRGNDMLLAGFVTTVASLLFGLVVGMIRAPLVDRIFWGVTVAAMMQAVCAEVILLDRQLEIYAWPITAGFAAVVSAGRSNLYFRMIASAATAGTLIAAYVVWVSSTPIVIVSYVACAAIGGALLNILVDGVGWLERVGRIPQPAVALALVLGAIGFSLAAPKLIPGW